MGGRLLSDGCSGMCSTHIRQVSDISQHQCRCLRSHLRMTQADVRTALEWDGGSWKPVAANAALAAAAAAGGSEVAAEEGGSDAMAEPATSKPKRGKKEAQPKPAPYQVSAHSHADVYTHSEIPGPVLVKVLQPQLHGAVHTDSVHLYGMLTPPTSPFHNCCFCLPLRSRPSS